MGKRQRCDASFIYVLGPLLQASPWVCKMFSQINRMMPAWVPLGRPKQSYATLEGGTTDPPLEMDSLGKYEVVSLFQTPVTKL